MAHDKRSARLRSAAQIAAGGVATLAVAVLVGGWVAGMDALRTFGGAIPTKPNTAICLLLSAIALFWLADPRGRCRRTARALAGTVGVIGLVTAVEYATGRALGIDELLFNDTTHTLVFLSKEHVLLAPPGRMAPQTAVLAMLTAIALLGIDWRPRGWWPAGILSGLVAALATTAVLGHVYSIASLYMVRPFVAMSTPTAAGFVLLAIGISCARPDRGVVAALTADTTAGVLLRFLAPPALVVPLIVGTLVMVGERHGLYGDGEGISLLVVATVFGCFTFAIAAAGTLQSLDAQRREADERLKDQTHRYRTLVERLPLITYADALDQRNSPIYISPQVEATLGYTPEEWVADPELFVRIVHPEDRERVLAAVARMRDTGEPLRAEYRLRSRDGREVWILDETVRINDRDGRPLHAQGYMLDITDRKAAEEEARVLEAQLSQAQKLESIGQLAGGVAHDFNNMLGAITAYVGFAEAKALDRPDIVKELAQIRLAAERGAELTDQLLVFSRKDMIRPQLIDLGETIEDTRTLLHPLLVDDVVLRFQLSDTPRYVWADPMQIKRILLNLMLNARAAMPSGGVIQVSLLDADGAADSALDLAPGCYHALTVKDTGEGMGPEVAARAFEPFFTTKPNGEGTGLGLAIVYGIAKRLGGEVKIDSQRGSGTTVTVLLPTAELEDVVRSLPAHSRSATEGRNEVVLVVDDDDALRRSTSRILSERGYAVLEARDGVEGLEVYRQADSPPSVVVTDVVMPRMGGIELAAAVNGAASGPSVVFMSGYAEDLEEVDEHFPLVTKPFEAGVLLNAVSEALSCQPQTAGATGDR